MTDLTIIPPTTLDGSPYRVTEDEQTHFINTVNRALFLGNSDNAVNVSIALNARTLPKTTAEGVVYDAGGWLEHLIVVSYYSGSKLLVGAIQRKVGGESEFHS